MLVRRYLPAVVEPGERSLIFIDGIYSHAVRKRSLFLGGRHAGPEGVRVQALGDELAAAQQVLEGLTGTPTLYARVDLLRDERGKPRLMELEMVEPSLFLDECQGSASRLAAALEERDEVTPSSR
jgi:O-ureido-D-serine cyclo-ligase